MPSPDTRRRLLSSTVLISTVLLAGCTPNATSRATSSAAPAPSAAATSPPPGSRVTPAPMPSSESPTPTSATAAEIERLLAAIAADPNDAESQRDLGFALLQRVREIADPSLYEPAAAAFEAARRLAPDDALVLVGIGGLQLGKHEFADALTTGRMAAELSPTLASARAVIVDALVELGRYDEAAAEILAARAYGADDARLRFHDGAIGLARGDRTAGRSLLESALASGPALDPLERAEAGRLART